MQLVPSLVLNAFVEVKYDRNYAEFMSNRNRNVNRN